MKIQPEELLDYPMDTLIRWGRSGCIEQIPPIFWDYLSDYIDYRIDKAKKEALEHE